MATIHQDFLNGFNDARGPLLAAMLAAIGEACPGLTESIKWNAPNFTDAGRDRLTFMLHKPESVSLILHTGVRPKEDKKAPRLYADDSGLLEWNSNIRATITFRDLADFDSKRELFKKAVKRWLDETRNL